MIAYECRRYSDLIAKATVVERKGGEKEKEKEKEKLKRKKKVPRKKKIEVLFSSFARF